jgi:hypothetical protein
MGRAGVDPSPVDRGKSGSGHHLIRDGSCTPLKVITTGGNVPAITEALALVDDVPSAAGRVGVGVRLALPRKTQAAPVPPGAPVTRVTRVGTSDASCPGVGSCLSSSLEASPTSAASASSATSSRGPSPRSTGSSASPPAGNDASTSTNHSSHSSHSHAPSSTGGGSTSRHHDRVTSSEPRSTGRDSGRRPVDRPEVGPPACTPTPVRGAPATTTTGSPELRPGTAARTPAAGARWSLASDVNFGRASRARWNEQANTAPRAVAKPMGHLCSRCALHTSMISVSNDSGNHRPSIGRDHSHIA